EVALAGVADRRILLRDDDDEIVVTRRRLDRAHGCLAPDLERPDMAGQLDLGPERDHGVLTGGLCVLGHLLARSLRHISPFGVMSELRSACRTSLPSPFPPTASFARALQELHE